MNPEPKKPYFFFNFPAVFKENLKTNKLLYLSFFIFTLFFCITRLPFFLHDSIVLLSPDYQHYYMIVDQIHNGFLPTFNIRTPGYPLFLAFMFVFFKSNLAVIAVQNLFTLFSSLFFIFVINKIFGKKWKYLALLVAIGLGAFISLSIHLCLDTALATESIYINTILLFFSFLLLAIYCQNRMYWVCCGITMAMVILIRPSGLFLVPLFLAILLFLFLNAYKKKLILLFSISFVTPLIFLCIYNYFTIGSFAISTFTEHALISFTSTFLEKNPSYSPQIKRPIEKSLNRLSPHKKNIIKNSWDPKPLSHILLRHYNRNRRIIFQTLKSFEDKNADNLYMKWRPVLKKIAWDAIRDHPDIYLKFFYSNLNRYFLRKKNINFYIRLQGRYRSTLLLKERYIRFYKYRAPDTLRLYYKNEYIKTIDQGYVKNLLKEYWNLRTLHPGQKSQLKFKTLKLHFLQKVHNGFLKIHKQLFHNKLWIFFFFFSFIFSSIKTLVTRFHHRGSFFMFVLTGSALLHGVVISISSFSDIRLSYPLDFIYYLSLFLIPIMLKPDSIDQKANKSG